MARRLRGRGLHSGAECEVRFTRATGTVLLASSGTSCRVEDLVVRRADRGVEVTLGPGGPAVGLVEHLLGALAGLSVYEGLAVEISGPEVPLLDGGAAELTTALLDLELPTGTPSLRVARGETFEMDDRAYSFRAGDGVGVEVTVDFPGVGTETAAWSGDPARFVADVAWARTFGYRHEHEALRRQGRAAHVDPTAVMVLGADGTVAPPGAARRDRELARHKLLDLLGDFRLFGGPPIGHVAATRPGHAATHEAIRRALADGVLVRTSFAE